MSNTRKNLVLIGFMGSGKTSVGRWISQNANMAFYDTDEYIEKNQSKEIKDIFAAEGEAYFRDLETQTIRFMSKKLNDSVISVGGGLPLREENQKLLKKLGYVVYLRAEESSLVKRLKNDSKRPLLAGDDMEKKIHELMQQRESIYLSVADMIVDTDEKTFAQIYNEIEDHILLTNAEKTANKEHTASKETRK